MLLTNLSIATMVNGYGVIEKGAVAIEKGVIKSVGPDTPKGNAIDCGGRLLTRRLGGEVTRELHGRPLPSLALVRCADDHVCCGLGLHVVQRAQDRRHPELVDESDHEAQLPALLVLLHVLPDLVPRVEARQLRVVGSTPSLEVHRGADEPQHLVAQGLTEASEDDWGPLGEPAWESENMDPLQPSEMADG